jgi:hypothetical protein
LGGSCFLQVCLLSCSPGPSNHKLSLLRKKEDNNQDNDDTQALREEHYDFPFADNKEPPLCGWGGSVFPDLVREFVLLSHFCRLNHKQALNNKDYQEDDNKGEEKLYRHRSVLPVFRPIIGFFRIKSRAKFQSTLLQNELRGRV